MLSPFQLWPFMPRAGILTVSPCSRLGDVSVTLVELISLGKIPGTDHALLELGGGRCA